MTITMQHGFGKDAKEEESEITCIHCDGKPMSELEAEKYQKALNREKNRWCKCGNPSGHTNYVPDTPRRKHHWNCADCGKMLQEG
jgi:hypothetical protein